MVIPLLFPQAVDYAKQMLSPVRWAEVVFTSAKTGQRCLKVLGYFLCVFFSFYAVKDAALHFARAGVYKPFPLPRTSAFCPDFLR